MCRRPGTNPAHPKAGDPDLPESEREQFDTITYQMGGMMLFPGRQIDGKPSINQERGFNSQIADRLDLTVECIRLHYLGETSPMAEALVRYGDFFALFKNFNGYTDFFLLQDLVSADSSAVKFFMPFADFGASRASPNRWGVSGLSSERDPLRRGAESPDG